MTIFSYYLFCACTEEHALQVQYNGWQDRKTNFLLIYCMAGKPEPNLDFWGPYANCVGTRGRGGGGGFEWLRKKMTKRICPVHSALNHAREQYVFCGSLCFQLVFFRPSKRLFTTVTYMIDRFLHKRGDSTTLQ